MADNDSNVMQAQLGLSMAGSMSGSPMGMPTPMPPPPPMKHPGDAARDAVQMTQTMAMNTMQSAQAVNFASMGTPGGGFGGGGMGGGGGWGMGGFANQYRQNMVGIQQQQLNPWMAGSMASMMGSGGYQAGMMPSPIQMTQPAMGIYRPPPQMPMGQIPPVPQMPLFPTPFTPNMPSPMFSTPFDYNMQRGEMRGIQHTAAALSLPGVAARAGTAAIGGWAGAGLGAHMGARFGAGGAAIGAAVGGFAGMMGAEHFAGAGVQGLVDQMNPFDRMARHTAQIRGMSQEFVVGGSGLSAGGRGLGLGASAHVGRQLNNLAADSGFQRQTGSQFSSQDLMKITQISGQQGLLDMAQNPEQIVSQVKNVSKALTAFMKLASEPDVTEALKQMGQMRQMGLTLGETMQAMQGAKSYSRMAGTSVQGIMQSGLAGAMTFQQQGLSGGLGLNVGMGSMGMARQAVAGGTYTTQQLAMLGGTQGVAQNNMEMSAAMLKQPLMAAAMSGFGAGGTFGLNAGNMRALAGGGLGINQLATMGVNNMNAAVARGGVSAIGAFQMQQGELEDQMGRALGPEGIKMMGFQQIRSTRQFLGLKGPGGTFAAAKAMGMTDDQAKQSTLEMSSPEFFQNMQRQIHITRQEQRAEAREQRKADAPTILDKMSEKSDTVRGARGAFRNVGVGFDDMVEGVTSALSRSGEESAANRTGQTVVRQGRVLLAQNPLEARMVDKITMKEMRAAGVFNRDSQGRSDAIFRTGEGRGIGHSETLAAIRRDVFGGDSFDLQQMREAQGGLKGVFGGGKMETVARMLTLGTGFDNADQNDETRADIRRGSESTMRGLKASAGERAGAHGALAKGLGVDKKTAAKVSTTFAKKLAAIAKEKANLIGGSTQLTDKDYQRAIQETAVEHKGDGVDATKLSANRSQLEKTSVQRARDRAGTAADAIRGTDIVDKASLLKSVEDAEQAQTDRGIRLMGDEGGVLSKYGIGGDASRREAMMQKIFTEDEDPRVGQLAVLKAAHAAGDEKATKALDAMEQQLSGSEKGQQILERAGKMQKAFGKDVDMAIRVGKSGMAFNKDTFERERTGYLAEKTARQYRSGLSQIADKDLLAAAGSDDARDILRAAGGEGKGLSGKAVALAKEYHAKGTSEERKAEIEEKLGDIAKGRGHAEESGVFGGLMDAAADKMSEFKSKMVGEEAAAASADFPDAVAQFAEASRSLERAADALGTRLGDGVNPWGS